MTPHGRKIWGSKQGQSLMRAMLSGEPLKPIHREVLEEIKRGEPPNLTEEAPNDPARGRPSLGSGKK